MPEGLLGDDFQFTNKQPVQDKHWSESDAQYAWVMFIEGIPFSAMSRRVGRNLKAVKRQIQNQLAHDHRHPTTQYKQRVRTGQGFTQRDVWVLTQGSKDGLSENRLAELLGRSVEEISKHLTRQRGLL